MPWISIYEQVYRNAKLRVRYPVHNWREPWSPSSRMQMQFLEVLSMVDTSFLWITLQDQSLERLCHVRPLMWSLGAFQVALVVKKPPANASRLKRWGFYPWVEKIPWRRAQQPTLVFLPGESHGLRSLAGYSLRGHKESDMTEVT